MTQIIGRSTARDGWLSQLIAKSHPLTPVIATISKLSRLSEPVTLIVNLAIFGVLAGVAFGRNVNALFYHYDGAYALTHARDQLTYPNPIFAFSNEVMQSIGNINLLQNPRLLFFFWPIAWFADLRTAKIACYVIVAVLVFLSSYGLARLLSQPRAVALVAGWLLGFAATPFVPRPFFYEILNVAPTFALLPSIPIVVFALTHASGKSGVATDVACALGLLALTFFVLAASPTVAPLLAPGSATYGAMAFISARNRSELWRKLAVAATALATIIAMRWPWYLLGLFSDSAPYFFPNDFSPTYVNATYVSILFQARPFGWAGPLIVTAAVSGAIVCQWSSLPKLRISARMLLGWVAALVAGGIALSVPPHWILPPPIYFEMAIWPLYSVFAAIALFRLSTFLVKTARAFLVSAAWIPDAEFILPTLLATFAFCIVISKVPGPGGYPFPPQVTPVVDILRSTIALHSDSKFNGRVATITPVDPHGDDAWSQQFTIGERQARDAGNDEMSLGLWYYRIPTLFEYNQYASPVFHALVRRTLEQPALTHQRNITIFSYPNARVLKLLGVRYVLTPQPAPALGQLQAVETRDGQRWSLFELSQPNLATYSPTQLETRPDLAATLTFIANDKVDLSKQAVTQKPIDGTLAALTSSSLSMINGDFHVMAKSSGKSLLAVPVEYSHCLTLRETRPLTAASPEMLRIDGLLTGILFERGLDATLSFRVGPLTNPLCRWRDFEEIKAMTR
jgi:hypothetical protein